MIAETDSGPRARFLRMGHIAGPLAALALGLAALAALHHMSRTLSWAEVSAALAATDTARLALAALATAVGFAAMGGYDVVATRIVAPGRVPWPRAAWAGATGFAFSDMLGFHLLTGSAVRYRFYRRMELDAGTVGQILILTWAGLWLGFLFVGGAAFLLDPAGLAPLGLPPLLDRLIGAALLALLVAIFLVAGRRGRAFRIRGWTMPLPGRGPLALQLLLGTVDILAAGLALYVLLPPDLAPNPAVFVAIYITAVVLGAASHVPGGLGVVDATLVLALGGQGRADLLAALLIYRLVYFVAPFLLAAIGLALLEADLRARLALRRRLERLAPPAAAALVFAAGLALIVTGAGPAGPQRLGALRSFLPLAIVEASSLLATLSGLFLLVIAHGLFRRLYAARLLATGLLLAGAGLALARGLDWEASLALLLAALLLTLARGAFRRRAPEGLRSVPWRWLALVAFALGVTIWLGLFFHRHVPYATELWWRFAWEGDAPRFLRASLLAAASLAVLALHLAVTRPIALPPAGTGAIPAAVPGLIARFGHAEDNVALLGDKAFLMAPDDRAFLAYARAGRSLVAMGGPVGEAEVREELVWEFRERADAEGRRAVFYGIEPPDLPLLLDLGHAFLKLGEIARVDLARLDLAAPAAKDLRYAHRRAAREGLAFAVVPASAVPELIPELRAISDAWLAAKGGREKGFSLGRFDPAYLARFPLATMRKDDRIVAFANLWQAPATGEASFDLMRYRSGVSHVLMDAFFVEMMLAAKAEGFATFDLGAAPLAGLADHPLASTWEKVGTAIFRHGEHFYHFEGLRAFKAKFNPVWTPRFLACPPGLAVPQVLLDVARLIARRTRPPRSQRAPG